MTFSNELLVNCGKVLSLFLIPVGGGIPAGVLLGKARHVEWPLMILLYFISDLILACVFEPLMLWFIKAAKNSKFLTQWAEAHKLSVKKMGFEYGVDLGPLALIMLSLGIDPMTSRAAAKAAGHGFIKGWTFAICGDMIFFLLIMSSTLWLNSLLGDGTWASVIIISAMILVPLAIRKWKNRKNPA